MGLVFDGEHTVLHHQHAQMVDLLIKQTKMNMNRMNQYATSYVPNLVTEEEKEMKKDVTHKEEELETQQN